MAKAEMSNDVEILHFSNGRWQHLRCNIQQLCQARDKLEGRVLVRLPHDLTCSPQQLSTLCSAFDIDTSTWTFQYQKATGYFTVQEKLGPILDQISFTTSFRFLVKHVASDQPRSTLDATIAYSWTEIGFWTAWKSTDSSIMLCTVDNNDEAGFWASICKALLEDQTKCAPHPFGWHVFVIPHVTAAFDRSVWACRDVVRHIEHNRPSLLSSPPNYRAMHELARHAIHISENVAMAIKVVGSLEQEILDIRQPTSGSFLTSVQKSVDWTGMIRVVRGQKTLLQCAHGRADALTVRVNNEIGLAFHVGSERDGHASAQMARAMQQDSTAMRTISMLGLVFLPGTFVSAVYSMSFFQCSTGDGLVAVAWSVSSEFWIYWATAIPLTVVTVAIWYFCQRQAG